ncbi:MAG TPA: metallophosphoesterase [Gemmatimonadales bacterium]|nr:metallophosphoesterase [Gemmatimonadales bacterium]
MRLIYLLLFAAPQLLLYLYLRERLPEGARPGGARLVRAVLAAVFIVFNVPWLLVARRVLFGSVWGLGRIPFMSPWVAWQFFGWIFLALVVLYLAFKGVLRVVGWLEQWRLGRVDRVVAFELTKTAEARLTRRQFLARATYAYAATGAALSGYGIWNAYRMPVLTRKTLMFPDLPVEFDGLTILHLSDLHAGVHLEEDRMHEIVAQVNALRPDLIVQTGDMIDISPSYVPAYVRAFRDLSAPLGCVTVLGNHDHYTGADVVARGVRDAGHTLLMNDCRIIERGNAQLALLGIDDPETWHLDDPQHSYIERALRQAPPAAFRILLAHRPGAWDGAVPHGIPLTLAGHIHGGQFYLPVLGWSAGRLITKYVMGHFQNGASQLYVSRGIGVVGVPIRMFVPPEIELFELRRVGG